MPMAAAFTAQLPPGFADTLNIRVVIPDILDPQS
jgi:hypothetical protein